MSATDEAPPSVPQCKRCGASSVDKLTDEDGVIPWCCKRCGTVFGTPK